MKLELSCLDILLVLLPVLATNTEQELCTLEEFHRCLNSLQSVTANNDLAFASTRQELLDVCRDLQESVLCVDDHMKLCFTPVQRKVFNQVVAGARQVIEELCVDGPIQQSYLRHALCFKNISLDEDKCAPMYQNILKLSENVEDEPDVEDGLRKSCCAFREFVHCKYLHVSQDCGSEAGEFLQEHLEKISAHLMYEHCATYTYGSEACSIANINLLTSFSYFLIVFSVLNHLK
ncbi:uncharacterized protein [Centruroides vittatus]|uniref:uncharacterized protein n=1 Tax=Centruroides vittatus TaxID=120091 RepID=UPI003510C838